MQKVIQFLDQPVLMHSESTLDEILPQDFLVKIKKSSETKQSKERLFLINTVNIRTLDVIEVTIRRVKQAEYLSQYVNNKYGGFIIPVLDVNRFFNNSKTIDEIIQSIEEYLNDMLKNYHTKKDKKLYQFIFHQEVHFPNIQTYDRVLNDAAIYSRRYLNSIFTRKDTTIEQHNPKAAELIEKYQLFLKFAKNFQQIKKIIVLTIEQQECVEDIFGSFCQIGGGLAYGIQPIQYIQPQMKKQLLRIQKIINQAHQSFYRWEVLHQTVKQLQCNVYKGLHQDNLFFKIKEKQLVQWSQSLGYQFIAAKTSAEAVLQKICVYFYHQKKQQSQCDIDLFMKIGIFKEQKLIISTQKIQEISAQKIQEITEKIENDKMIKEIEIVHIETN